MRLILQLFFVAMFVFIWGLSNTVIGQVIAQSRDKTADEHGLEHFTGHWNVEFANGIRQDYEIDKDQSVTVNVTEHKWSSQGRIEIYKNDFIITFQDDRVERWSRIGNRIVVEHWHPASRLPTVRPVLGIGERVSKRVPSITVDGVEILHEVEIAKLQTGARVPHGNGFHEFLNIPDRLQGRHYTKRHGFQGTMRFRVLEEQTIFLAMYGHDWGGGGNPSGNWQRELVSRNELEDQGWHAIASLNVKQLNPQDLEPQRVCPRLQTRTIIRDSKSQVSGPDGNLGTKERVAKPGSAGDAFQFIIRSFGLSKSSPRT